MVVSAIEEVHVRTTHTHDRSGSSRFTRATADVRSGLAIANIALYERKLLTLLGRTGGRLDGRLNQRQQRISITLENLLHEARAFPAPAARLTAGLGALG